MTKTQDQLLFAYYNKNDHVRVTDLHQGIVWGTQTKETRLDERLINRFDYDGDYGTVLNRFLMQAAIGYPLTVHGTGGQTRAFIHIQDTVAASSWRSRTRRPHGERVRIFNQMTETHRVRDLAKMVSRPHRREDRITSPNPRNEADENELYVDNDRFLHLGLAPITLSDGLMRRSPRSPRSTPSAATEKDPLRLRLERGRGRRQGGHPRPRLEDRSPVGLRVRGPAVSTEPVCGSGRSPSREGTSTATCGPLLSTMSEKSRRRLKMIVSRTTTCFQPRDIVSIANCQSCQDSPLAMSRWTYGNGRCASRGVRHSES